MSDKGTCTKHGEFILEDGCPQCLNFEDHTAEDAEEDWKRDQAEETAIALRLGEDIEARGYYEQSMRLLEYAEKRIIATADDNKVATDDLKTIKHIRIMMDDKRKSYLAPLKLQTEAIRQTYDFLMVPIFEADRITRGKMTAFNLEEERKAKAAEELNRQAMEVARKQAEMNNGEFTVDLKPVEVSTAPRITRSALGTSGMVDHWKYRIVDIDKLPREYMIPDDAMLKAIAKASHDKKPIPGVEFYNEPFVAVRR